MFKKVHPVDKPDLIFSVIALVIVCICDKFRNLQDIQLESKNVNLNANPSKCSKSICVGYNLYGITALVVVILFT